MEGSAAFSAHQSAADSLHQVISVGFDADDGGELDSEFMENGIECRCLCRGTREAVKNPALLAVFLSESFLDDTNSYAVRYKVALVHVAFCFLAKSSS